MSIQRNDWSLQRKGIIDQVEFCRKGSTDYADFADQVAGGSWREQEQEGV